MAKKKVSNLGVFVEVLQNGVSVGSAVRPVTKRGKVSLSATDRGDIVVPLYPLTHDVVFIEFRNGKIILLVEHHWEGFATSAGELIHIDRTNRGIVQFELLKGDYAGLSLGDLRILVRIDDIKPKKAAKVRPDAQYRKGFLDFVASDGKERMVLVASIGLALTAVSAFAGTLALTKFHRPTKFVELSRDYTLPFIDSHHFRTSPEVLQTNLVRRDYVGSIVRYVSALVATTNDEPIQDPQMVFPSTQNTYELQFAKQKKRIQERTEQQRQADAKAKEEQVEAVLYIPSAVGESFKGSLLRLSDKIGIIHATAEINYSKRREFLDSFRQDKLLNLSDYRSSNKVLTEKGLGKLSDIKVMELDTNEVRMYKVAREFEAESRKIQNNIRSHSAPDPALTPINDSPIAIPAGIRYSSFLPNPDYVASDDKLYLLKGSTFGKAGTAQKSKPPPTGKIDPDLIKKAIEKRKFELQLCYELSMRQADNAGGVMEWRWMIDDRGNISELELVSTTINDNRMVGCIKNKMATWRFPRPRNGSVEVRFPFEFKPARG